MPTGFVTPNSATVPALQLITTTSSGAITGVNAVGSVGIVSASSASSGTMVEAAQLATEIIAISTANNVAASQVMAEVVYVVTSTTLAEAVQVTAEVVAENPVLQARPVQVIVEVLSLPPSSLYMTQLSCVVPFDNNLSLPYSDTRGAAWSNRIKQSLGNQGEFDVDISFRRLGMSRDRVWEVSWSCNLATALLGAFVKFDLCAT